MRDPEWRSSTAGALCAITRWLAATAAAHVYFERVNNYSPTYGHLDGVVTLLLWLYVTSGAILIGGEMNSEIQKAARQPDRTEGSERTDGLTKMRLLLWPARGPQTTHSNCRMGGRR